MIFMHMPFFRSQIINPRDVMYFWDAEKSDVIFVSFVQKNQASYSM